MTTAASEPGRATIRIGSFMSREITRWGNPTAAPHASPASLGSSRSLLAIQRVTGLT